MCAETVSVCFVTCAVKIFLCSITLRGWFFFSVGDSVIAGLVVVVVVTVFYTSDSEDCIIQLWY